jgi:hypothetical protein
MFKYIGFAVIVGIIFFAISKLHMSYEDDHTSLNDHNLEADLYLGNARHYMKENAYERSVFHIEKAKTALRELEYDIDLNSGEEIEKAIKELDLIEAELENDSLVSEDMYAAFSHTMQTISLAELRISEKYAESNKMDISMVALKYSKLHLKNALNYTKLPDQMHSKKIYEEMDSLMSAPKSSPVETAEKIDRLIKELDSVVQSN